MNVIKGFVLFFIVLFGFSAFCAEKPAPLIIAYGDHNGAPYAIEQNEKLQSGIIKDVAKALANELNITVTFVKTPRKRVERYLANNTIHVVLISSPQWLSNHAKLQWSDPLFIEHDKIVTKVELAKETQRIEDLKQKVIGTIRGYSYPTLQPFFDEKLLIRYDVASIDDNFTRLEMDRIDALVDSDILINYQLKNISSHHMFKVLPFNVSTHKIQAALSPNSPIALASFNQALNTLNKKGIIADIINKYQ